MNPADEDADGQVLYELIDNKFVVSYIDHMELGGATIENCITAQLVLYPDGSIKMNYQTFGTELDLLSCHHWY